MRIWLWWLLVAVVLLLIGLAIYSLPSHAQMTGNDWCQGPNPAKQSKAISITNSAAENLLVDAVANQAIQVCGFVFDLSGTTPTAEFDYGTHVSADCDTGATALTGAMTTSKTLPGPLDYFTTPVSKQLCLKLGGTTPNAYGVLTYV